MTQLNQVPSRIAVVVLSLLVYVAFFIVLVIIKQQQPCDIELDLMAVIHNSYNYITI